MRAMSARGSGGSVTTKITAPGAAPTDMRNDLAIDFGVRVKKPQPTFGIVTIRSSADLFVDTGSDHHQRHIRQIVVVPVDDCRLWTKRRSVAKISRDRLGAFGVPVHDDDVPGTPPDYGRERTCRA